MTKSMISSLMLLMMVGGFIGCKKENNTPIDQDFDPTKHGDYFVAPDGSDMNPGTYEEPWATWQRAFEVAEAGDTVYFRGGVYKPEEAWYDGKYYNCLYMPHGETVVGHDGEPGNPICYFNFPGEEPILDCEKIEPFSNFNTAINMSRVNFVHFRGLTIRNVLQTRDYVECFGIGATGCSNITFERITIHNVEGNAFRYGSSFGTYPEIPYDTVLFINCDAYNCADILPREPGATLGGAADGYKTWGKPGTFMLFEGCRSWNNSDDGFDPGTDPVTVINNCWSFNNGYYDGDGTGFKTGGMLQDNGSTVTRLITNCIAANNSHSGLMLLEYDGYYRTNARIYNNLFYKNGGSGAFFSNNPDYPDALCEWRNNIALENKNGPFSNAYQPYVESHNSWDYKPDDYPGYTITDTVKVADFVSLDIDQLSGKRQKDGSLPEISFGHLKEGSYLNTAGTFVGMSQNPPLGIDWDFLKSIK